MSDFVPRHVCVSCDFDIKPDSHGHWTVADRDGLVGGTFLTEKDAVRFAVAEADGDRTHVHIAPGHGEARHGTGISA